MSPTTPAPVAGVPIQPQATVNSPQGVASQVPVNAPTPPVLPQGQTPVATPAPVQQPNFNTSQTLNDIAAYYNVPRQTAAIAGAGQALGNVAQANYEQQKAQNQINITNQQNQLNPDAYQTTKNADGSITIYNSMGDKVDIGTMANLTGVNPAQYLQQAGATDEADQKFIAAYNNFQQYAQLQIAAKNGDAQAQAEVKQFDVANPGLANMELGQLQTAFMQQYGSYFGQPQQGAGGGNLAPGVTNTLSTENNPAATSAYENPTYTNLPGGSSQVALPYQPSPVANQVGATATGNPYADDLAQIQAQIQAQAQAGQ